MYRITISHINKYGPLMFPAKRTQIFIPDHKVPDSMLKGFYQRVVDIWFKEHDDRQQFGDYVKDIVPDNAITDPDKVYGPSDDIKGPDMEDL